MWRVEGWPEKAKAGHAAAEAAKDARRVKEEESVNHDAGRGQQSRENPGSRVKNGHGKTRWASGRVQQGPAEAPDEPRTPRLPVIGDRGSRGAATRVWRSGLERTRTSTVRTQSRRQKCHRELSRSALAPHPINHAVLVDVEWNVLPGCPLFFPGLVSPPISS